MTAIRENIGEDMRSSNITATGTAVGGPARLALEGLNDFLSSAEDRGGRIARARVGPLDVSYFRDAPAGTAYPFLELMLRSLLKLGNDGNGGLVRV